MEQETPKAPVTDIAMSGSRLFLPWLNSQQISLAFTSYQIGKLYFVGINQSGNLSVFDRSFDRVMGLATQGKRIWMSSRYQMWRFEDIMDEGQQHKGYDALYVPMEGRTTGNLDIHDVAVMNDGNPVFVVTRMNCLATLADDCHVSPVWTPPFISKSALEDRCHLNGLALKDGKPKYVTMVSACDVAEGWRDGMADGGILMDVETGEIVCSGLSMPHSPRWHNGRLWLLNAGTGEFGEVDLEKKEFKPMAFCPGFLRGMAIHGSYAIVGLSKARDNSFRGLALEDRLQKENMKAKCGLRIINLNTGDVEHSLDIEGLAEELFDVVALEGVTHPMALGFKTDEIEQVIKIGSHRAEG